MEYCLFDQSYRSKRAFTLIELLVVISIIAVLMAIMMPALAKVKAQAAMIVCKSQLKDLGTAINLYVTENDGRLPDSQAYTSAGALAAGGRWFEKIASYYDRSSDYNSVANNTGDNIYNFDFFRCPTQKKFVKQLLSDNVSAGASGVYGFNIYFTNINNPDKNDTNYKFNWRKISSIKMPAQLPLLADLSMEAPVDDGKGYLGVAGWRMNPYYPHPNAIVKYGWDGNLQRQEYDYFGPAPNHDGKTNYLFADGHCESLGLWPWSDHLGTDFHPVRNVRVNP
ncbi:MAG: prepilin-type N-terminal cleavage/methylation domain-containing protein [Sedimentisphaeraceae bacterium JB056]